MSREPKKTYTDKPRDTKRLFYHMSAVTTSGLVHSQTTSWKFHANYPEEPIEFARCWAGDYFRCWPGAVTVRIAAIGPFHKISYRWIHELERYDLQGELSRCTFMRIVGQFKFERKNYDPTERRLIPCPMEELQT